MDFLIKASVQLFANALFKEYRTVVLIIIIIALVILGWILWNTRNRWKIYIVFWGKFLTRLFREGAKLYKEIKKDVFGGE